MVATEYVWTDAGPTCATAYVAKRLLALLPEPPARVLDLGCGNGVIAGMIASRGYEVVGVDPSASGIAIAREAHPLLSFHIDKADPGLLGRIGERPFNAVVSSEVVEHVFDAHAWAECCAETVESGGVLLVTTPHHGYAKNLALSLVNGWDRHWGPLVTGGHIKFWSRRTLSALLREHGFVIERITGAGRPWPMWASMVSRARRGPDTANHSV